MRKALVLSYWSRMLASFWFVPALMGGAAAMGASALLWVDVTFGESWDLKGFGYGGSAEGATSILQVIASSMITIAGVVFSITLVTLSLASNQFGPRLLRNFMADKLNQVVLGMFAASFLYSILVLREVRRASDVLPVEFVPHVSIAGAVLLAIASIALLIYFIHHVAVSIQADEMIRNVAVDLSRAIDGMFPEQMGVDPKGGVQPAEEVPESRRGEAFAVYSERDGYVQVVEPDGLMGMAAKHDLLISLDARPGDYVVSGGVLARAWPRERVDEARGKDIASSFAIGTQRTPDQDLAYLFGQLVEIAVRALSPGLNDPFTVVACVDRLASTLRKLAQREMPATRRLDDAGRVRVLAEPLDFAILVDDAFDPIRRHARGETLVGVRMLVAIGLIAAVAHRDEDRQCLRRQADKIHRAFLEETREASDREALDRAYAGALAAFADSPAVGPVDRREVGRQ